MCLCSSSSAPSYPRIPRKCHGVSHDSVEVKKYGSLVLQGGGVRGAIYPGALIALEEAGLLTHIKKFAGTSAGSGTASFLALGLSVCDMLKVMEETDFKDFVDFSLPKTLKRAIFGVDTFNFFQGFVNKKGFFAGETLEKKFDMVIQRKLCGEFLGLSFSEMTEDRVLQNKKCAQFKQATFFQVFGDYNESPQALTHRSLYKHIRT